MDWLWKPEEIKTTPSENRPRSYKGGYMAAGRAAEGIVMAWLGERPEVIGVENLTELRQLREAGVGTTSTPSRFLGFLEPPGLPGDYMGSMAAAVRGNPRLGAPPRNGFRCLQEHVDAGGVGNAVFRGVSGGERERHEQGRND